MLEPCSIALYCESSLADRLCYAEQLAERLDLPLCKTAASFPYLLVVTDHCLELRQTHSKAGPVRVDFLNAASQYRRLKISKKSELIVRAVGIKKSEKLTVLDATAGLGQDGFILACLGCTVHYLERAPVIAALLQDGIDRLFSQTVAPSLALSLTVIDAHTYLSSLTADSFPDVIYLDPMFPEREKTALVKKEMRVLRDIVGYDEDTAAVLTLALACAKKRVVVKRPRLSKTLTAKTPDFVLNGQSSRFDIYLTSK